VGPCFGGPDTLYCSVDNRCAAQAQGNSAFALALVETLALGAAYGHVQPAAGLQLVEKLLLHCCDLLGIRRDVNQIVPLVRIGLQVVEAIMVPYTVIEDVLIP